MDNKDIREEVVRELLQFTGVREDEAKAVLDGYRAGCEADDKSDYVARHAERNPRVDDGLERDPNRPRRPNANSRRGS